MANNHSLNVYIDESGTVTPSYGVQTVDLECLNGAAKKPLSVLYDISVPSAPVLVHNETPNTKWFTAIYNCDGTFTVVDNPFNEVYDLLVYNCETCQTPTFGSEEFIEVANYAALPVTGSTSVIYVTLDDNKLYRWTGSTYVEVSGDSMTDAITLRFKSGVLNVTLDADYNMTIDSIIDVSGVPTTTITKNGSPYTLGSLITLGDILLITVSIASTIRLNYTKI